MATRALINFVVREDGVTFSEHPGVDKIHIQIYNHYDGYPSGLGVTLADYLQPFTVVNGLSSGQGKVANGIGCLAAQTVQYLKEGPGNVYLQKPGKMDWEDYEYFIWCKEGHGVWMSIFDYNGQCMFVGEPDKLITKYEYEDR
tara:strand:- start:1061 stop:1489 length:429 start_codon:yes stop_codon:yes gene_type:complete